MEDIKHKNSNEEITHLYHYTSLETLALILTNKTLCFNNLLYVDDMEEVETADMGNFGKYVYVSCWTAEKEESIALWNLYTPNMHGIRIKMPLYPFKKYQFRKGEYFLTEDVETFINFDVFYKENKASIALNQPKLKKVIYTKDRDKLFPEIRFCNSDDAVMQFLQAGDLDEVVGVKVTYDFKNLGRYKRNVWEFQKEWRYILNVTPMGLEESNPPSLENQQEFIRRIENKEQPAPYEKIFLDLDENAIREMEVLFGPKMTNGEKILARALLEKYGLSDKWQESSLRIR